jgi:hypothetical protein
MIMRIVAHGTIEEVSDAASLRPFLQQYHLMHIVAGETVRCGDEHAVDFAGFDGIAQAIKPRTRRAAPL